MADESRRFLAYKVVIIYQRIKVFHKASDKAGRALEL